MLFNFLVKLFNKSKEIEAIEKEVYHKGIRDQINKIQPTKGQHHVINPWI